jgi:diguanylate cyclase (GGDEF)-like protein
MNHETVTTNAHQGELRKAFLTQVPKRVDAILENWHRLVQDDWNPQPLNSLLKRLHTLTEASAKLQVSQIHSSGISLLGSLENYRSMESNPSHDDLAKLEGLIHAFRAAALDSCQNQPNETNPEIESPASLSNQGRIYLFGLDDSSVPGLKQTLEAKQLAVETVTFPEPLIEQARIRSETLGVIASIDRLEELYPEAGEGGLWHNDGGLPGVPVAFIATENDLQLRLAAMRTDAEAYWVQPIDSERVANRMLELMSLQSHTPYRILIVEDDPTQADFASAILRKARFECHSVTDPLQVMERLREFRPDLILMDLYMPGANGSELTTVIRERQEFVDIPVVFLSGEQDRDKQLNALSCGGEDFLAKPISPKHLIKTVTNRIQRAHQLNNRLGLFSTVDTRELLFERVEGLLKVRNTDKPQYAVIYLDIDHADEIIQQIGIGGMDGLLSEIGTRLRRVIRSRDSLGRFGDHSLGMVVNCSSRAELETLGKKLCAEIANHPIEMEDQTLKVTLSLGACFIDDTAQDASSLFSLARFASRLAHKTGGNQLHLQLPEQAPSAASPNDDLVRLIHKAVEDQYLEIYFQPIVDLKGTSDEAHYQALIRLQEPDGKLHTAAEFIPTAEQIGVIGKIDHWTTRNALNMIKRHKEQGQQLHLFISQAVDLLDSIERLSWLKETHRRGLIAAGDLTFEFRLLDLARHLGSAKVCFEMLHSINIMTLLTGYDHSSEAQWLIKNLPLEYVKLDTSLLHDPQHDLKALIASLQALKIKVIAPQVEDPRSIALLWSSGIDFVQGNFVQHPESNLLYDFNESVLN